MLKFTLILISVFLYSCSTTYYVVRHAEKDAPATMSMTSDVPLSDQGKVRAEALKNELKLKRVKHIYATNTQRAMETAKPLSEAKKIQIETYNQADASFIQRVKEAGRGNVLIVGHSNTVDDIVNGLLGRTVIQDLSDEQYGDLYVIQLRGRKSMYHIGRFGK